MQTWNGLGPDCIADTEDDPVNAAPCEEFPYGWLYQEDLCQCVARFECEAIPDEGCEAPLILEPVAKCSCISQEAYDGIVATAQQYGPDCIQGTPDDDDNDVGDDDCPSGYTYAFDICMCTNDSPTCVAPVCGEGE